MGSVVQVEVPGAGERTFDRIESRNPKRLEHPLKAELRSTTTTPLRSRSWPHIQLDQGREGACTGFSATMEAAASPKPLWGRPSQPRATAGELGEVARKVYYRARQLDVWEGEDYEGSSVDGACLAGRELGWWDAWVWATGSAQSKADQVIRAIAFRGPVMAGTVWKAGMDPDEKGFLSYSGEETGGHAYLLTKYSLKRDAVWTPNSWGGYGQGWITRADLVKMAGDDGDFALIKNRLKPKG